MQLDSLFAPKAIALVGASTDARKLSGRPLRFLVRHGFAGDVYPVHPRADSIDGIPCYRTVADLPSTPDVAVLALPAPEVPALAEQCGRAGIRHLVVFGSGFEETTAGGRHAARLREVALEYGMGVVGPNSEGLVSVPGRAVMTFGSIADRPAFAPGPVAILSQSGSIGGALLRHFNDAGPGCDYFVSLGNETVLSVADYLEWIVRTRSLRVVVCFIEALADGQRFLSTARLAVERGTAVVVLRGGKSEQGRQATTTHTGKLATKSGVYADLLREAGVTEVDSFRQAVLAAHAFAGPRLPRARGQAGDGVAVLGVSGGSRGLIADAAAQHDVPLARFEPATTAGLSEVLPDFAVVANPIDPTGEVISRPELFESAVGLIAQDPHAEALLIQYANRGLRHLADHVELLGGVRRRHELPVLAGTLGDSVAASPELAGQMAAAGIVVIDDPSETMRVLGWLYRWRAAAERQSEDAAGGSPTGAPVTAAGLPQGVHGWPEVRALLHAAGVRTPREALVELAQWPGAEHVLRVEGIAPPVVVKPSPDDVEHKSDLGVVHLGLRTPDAIDDAVRSIASACPWLSRVLIQEMAEAGPEVLVSLEDDPDFGPILGLGPGGYFVELIGELSYVALPSTVGSVLRVLAGTKLERLLEGHRGEPGVPLEAFAAAVCRLGAAFVALPAPPAQLELNPLRVRPADGALVALDALVVPASSDRAAGRA